MNNLVVISNLPSGPGHSEIDRITLNFAVSPPNMDAGGDQDTFVNNFEIYYRIYLSNVLLNSISEDNLNTINSTLSSDYNALKPYTVTTNNYAASVGTAFSSRSYWRLDYDNANLSLLRSNQLITPYPSDRLFFNTADLKNSAYLNTNNNADVVSNSSGSTYVYVSMYVVHTAFNIQTLSPYYSSPTFLGVFLLPDK